MMMKKIFSMLAILTWGGATAHAAAISIPWWDQAYICRPNTTKCYLSMGAGYDDTLWDSDGHCWGMKMICPDALTTGEKNPTPVARADIAAMRGISSDFDPSVLNGDCFGVRRTSSDGAMVSINGQMARVWCPGVLNHVDEIVSTGEVTFGTQPTCSDLAPDGWVAALNTRCYGRHYDTSEYFIECSGSAELPSRIVVLNGADYTTGTAGAIVDSTSAGKLFDKMATVSKRQRDKYFAE